MLDLLQFQCETFDQLQIQEQLAVGRDRAKADFRVAWNGQFAGNDGAQRCADSLRDDVSHRNTTARDGQNERWLIVKATQAQLFA